MPALPFLAMFGADDIPRVTSARALRRGSGGYSRRPRVTSDSHALDSAVRSLMGEDYKPRKPECRVIGCHGEATDHRKLCIVHYETYCVTGIRKEHCQCKECKN